MSSAVIYVQMYVPHSIGKYAPSSGALDEENQTVASTGGVASPRDDEGLANFEETTSLTTKEQNGASSANSNKKGSILSLRGAARNKVGPLAPTEVTKLKRRSSTYVVRI